MTFINIIDAFGTTDEYKWAIRLIRMLSYTLDGVMQYYKTWHLFENYF